MMINEFFLNRDEYESEPLKWRIISEIIGCEANYKFEDEVLHILVKRNPDIDKRDKNTKSIIDTHKANRDTAFECMYHFLKLYQSEYGEMTKAEKNLYEEAAKKYANIALEKFGWLKEKKEVTL